MAATTTLKLYTMNVRLTFTDEILGTMSNNEDIYVEHIIGNALEEAKKTGKEIPMSNFDEEIASVVNTEVEKGTTVFGRTDDGKPFLYDYQIRGFFKEACGFLRKAEGTKSSKVKAYKKLVDGEIFVKDRRNLFEVNGEITYCVRPLRASTMQGERVALSRSESIPAGSTITFTVTTLNKGNLDLVREWLDYGIVHGTGQWRNSGKGRFVWEELDADGNVIGGNKA
jgi:hypothetical protein